MTEEDPDFNNVDGIYIEPPTNENSGTEEDSDLSDQEGADINHLPRGILRQPVQIIHNSDSSDPEDNIPLAILQRNLCQSSKNINQKRKKTHKWSNNVPNNNLNAVCTPRPPSAKALAVESPVDFFKLFFDDKIMQNILTQTNLYGQQKTQL